MKRKPLPPTPNRIPADPQQWSSCSQGSVAAHFITEYVDESYQCWHCKKTAIFSARDQKLTYEVRKANVNQRRILCTDCWRVSMEIARHLAAQGQAWELSKASLKADKIFLSQWLNLLERQHTYVPGKHDTARENMLRNLLESCP